MNANLGGTSPLRWLQLVQMEQNRFRDDQRSLVFISGSFVLSGRAGGTDGLVVTCENLRLGMAAAEQQSDS